VFAEKNKKGGNLEGKYAKGTAEFPLCGGAGLRPKLRKKSKVENQERKGGFLEETLIP